MKKSFFTIHQLKEREATMWDPYAEFESTTLENGLTIHAAHWPERPWEAVGFLVHSGAQHDPIGREGVAHFVEHVVSEGTEIPRSTIKTLFRNNGGYAELGGTNYISTRYGFFAPATTDFLEKAFQIFGNMLFQAKLERGIEQEREIILEEINRDYPFKLKWDLDLRQKKMVHSGHWLERSVSSFGDPLSVSRITQSNLQSFYNYHYNSANTSIVAVGGMKVNDIIQIIRNSPLALFKDGFQSKLEPITDFPTPILEKRHVFSLAKHLDDKINSGSVFSVAKLPGIINWDSLRILRTMLADLLTEEVRQKRRWTYDIHCSMAHLGELYEFYINCKSLKLSAIDSIEEVIANTVAHMRDDKDLFTQVKLRLLASNLLVDETGQDVCDNAVKDLSRFRRIIPLQEMRENCNNTTLEDIACIAEWLRPERRWTLIMRP